MSKRLVQNVRKVSQFKDGRRGSRSPFTAKSVLLTGGVFLGALGVSTVGSGKGADASWLQSLTPGTLTVTGIPISRLICLVASCVSDRG
jgi:hypothetical protein